MIAYVLKAYIHIRPFKFNPYSMKWLGASLYLNVRIFSKMEP